MSKVKFTFRRGQVAIYLIMTLVVVFLLALMNVDSFLAVRGKNRVQNAGDAASLVAAKQQGILINEIARLNFEHLIAAAENDTNRCDEIVLRQRRLALLGPVDALRLANNAAKKNGMLVRDEFAKILRDHINVIRMIYAGGENAAGELYPESFPGAWSEYASALENVVEEGLAAGADNIEFYDSLSNHLLLNRNFYQAVASRDWCWFHFNSPALLSDYQSYHDWGALPVVRTNACENSEVFSLHVAAKTCAIDKQFTKEQLKELSKRYASRELKSEELDGENLLSDPDQTWFFFDERWGKWFDGLRLADEADGGEFPLVGEVKEEYNVLGCAAICRCINEVDSFALESSADLTWAAAAKPFGIVEPLESNDSPVVTAINKLIVPCMSDVRLVPLDSVGGANLATADYDWVTHSRYHLFSYLKDGPGSPGTCFYCQQLVVWERESFRRSGIIWLKYNSGSCVRPTGGSGGSGGGTSHGH